jgi:polar amino acid transport system substrate-binding protein
LKKLYSVLTISLLVLFMAACSTTSSNSKGDDEGSQSVLEKAREEGKIVVGFSGEKPYAYEDENGNLTGQSVEVAKAVFKELGIEEVEGVLTKFGSLIPGLQSGQFDVITAGMYITPERCEQVLFGEPEYSIGEALAVQKGNPLDLHSYEDIVNNPDVKVAIMNGAIEIDYLKAMGIDENQFEIVQDIPSNITALESGRVDAITMTGPTLESALATANAKNIERVEDFTQPIIDGESIRGYGAAAFSTTDEDLVAAYNEELAKIKESGQLLDIISEFGFTEADMPGEMTAEQLCN